MKVATNFAIIIHSKRVKKKQEVEAWLFHITAISRESFCAFSHSQSREVIMEYLKGTIANDTVSTEYRNNNPYIDWKVAEDILSVIPLLGILTAV